MPIDLTGIQNENEFYSDHYLTTVFEGTLKETVEGWNSEKEEGAKTPYQNISALSAPFLKAASDYKKTRKALERVQIFRKFTYEFLTALGYHRKLEKSLTADDTWVPTFARLKKTDGANLLWIVEALAPEGDDFISDPLGLEVSEELAPKEVLDLPDKCEDNYEKAISTAIFGLDDPPRFILLISMAQAVLIDRNKWAESRLLRFDFTEIFGRKETSTFKAVAGLLHKDSLAPDSGTALIDQIDEESNLHARGVSKDLKYALREAIELIGNEAAEQTVARNLASGRTAFQSRDGTAALDARQLSLECLRYMYRILFLFYIEARPDLGFAPMKSEAYRKGYSLETLRELELVPLTSDEEKNGHYLHDSISLLFKLVYNGTPYSGLKASSGDGARDFDMHQMHTHLFDPDSTPILSKVSFNNETLQRVIQLMSLSKEGRGNRGRISYAQLGINQLGAVYETLLSYSGFFAKEDLYEVKKAKEANPDPLEAAYFVPNSDIDEYKAEEVVYEGNEPKIYQKGTFIYRLAGRDREDSASYYTPEILTRCLVKYTLKELLKDKTADDILKFTICEPAMGSAAFLIEAVNQLSDAYLKMKQEELGERIAHEQYSLERQKVRAYITDRNTFGVDLNPVAMELGQVSLWLNCIHEGDFIPWFGDQLFAGNSLIGARREVYPISILTQKTAKKDRWFNMEPRQIKLDAPRQEHEVYHFLLPDPKMADYKKKVIGDYVPEEFEKLSEWRREFMKPLESHEIKELQSLSKIIDVLFEENAENLAKERIENTDPLSIWGLVPEEGQGTDFRVKDKRLAGMQGESSRNAVPYQRLKTAMDYWCSLWFWPIDKVDQIPDRATFLMDMGMILSGDVLTSFSADMFERETILSTSDEDKKDDLFAAEKSYGHVDIKSLKAKNPRLHVVGNVTETVGFFHWHVEIGDILLRNDGFDMMVGNPPWKIPKWNDNHELSDMAPYIAIRKLSSAAVSNEKTEILNSELIISSYVSDYSILEGTRLYLGAAQNNDLVEGVPDLYKCFIAKVLGLMSANGISGLLHPIGHHLSPGGQKLRNAAYRRLLSHYQFMNAFKEKMFADIGHKKTYSINIYSGENHNSGFDVINNLFLPSQIDDCYNHDGIGDVPAIKTLENKWELRGNKSRIVHIGMEELKLFASLMESEKKENVFETRIPSPHTIDIVNALYKLMLNSKNFKESVSNYFMSSMWCESVDTKKTKILCHKTDFRPNPLELVITGPNIFVGNFLFKTPRRVCNEKSDFDIIDLSEITSNYMPRSKYTINVPHNEFVAKLPKIPWQVGKTHNNFYRLAHRRMTRPDHERTLKAAIIPPEISHVNTIISAVFEHTMDLLNAAGCWFSLPYDFIMKVKGNEDLYENSFHSVPWVRLPDTALSRILQLSCVTNHYTDLWNKCVNILQADPWTSDDRRLQNEGPDKATNKWNWDCALRTDFARRQALIELDVLVSITLGISLNDLIQMYRIQFPVLQYYDRDTWYDQNGRIVFTSAKTGVGLGRKEFELSKNMVSGTISKPIVDDTQPGGPVERTIEYLAPFTLPDREADYAQAWAVFYPKYGVKKSSGADN
jgi:hypothetical protein